MLEIQISDMAYAYLKKNAVPFEDTPTSVLDRIIVEHEKLSHSNSETKLTDLPSLSLKFGVNDIPNVAFTTIQNASVQGNKSKHYWNDIVSDMIGAAIESGATLQKLKVELGLQLREGSYEDNGYRTVPNTDISFQGVDANRACKTIAQIASMYDIKVVITFRWQSNPKAQFADQIGELTCP